MIVVPTQKLYFKRYTHCVKMHITKVKSKFDIRDNKIIGEIRKFLSGLNSSYKTRLDWGFNDKQKIEIVFSVYLSDTDDYEQIMKKYEKIITWVSKPISEEHKQLLASNTEIIFRERLLFNKFRYKILLNVGWKREYYNEIKEWVKNQFGHKPEGKKGEYMLGGYWSPTLYLIEDDDIMMVKLSLSDRIRSVVRVDRFSDHGLTKESLTAT